MYLALLSLLYKLKDFKEHFDLIAAKAEHIFKNGELY